MTAPAGYMVENRLFWAWQVASEQQWLEDRSEQGLELVAWRAWNTYVFRHLENPRPQEYLIERKWIMFPNPAHVEERYLNERAEEGWDLVQPAAGGWYFFRRDKKDC